VGANARSWVPCNGPWLQAGTRPTTRFFRTLSSGWRVNALTETTLPRQMSLLRPRRHLSAANTVPRARSRGTTTCTATLSSRTRPDQNWRDFERRSQDWLAAGPHYGHCPRNNDSASQEARTQPVDGRRCRLRGVSTLTDSSLAITYPGRMHKRPQRWRDDPYLAKALSARTVAVADAYDP
jgi:hypothetical protein